MEGDGHLQARYTTNVITVTCESTGLFTEHLVDYFLLLSIKVTEVDRGLELGGAGVRGGFR